MDLYDEFGNYIGPDLDGDDEAADLVFHEDELFRSASPVSHRSDDVHENHSDQDRMEEDEPANQIVLHEDKLYYPSATEVFGEDVEALVQEEDTQPLTMPIIAPEKKAKTLLTAEGLPATTYNKQYLVDLMAYPELTRNVALVGHLHHGKTALMDMLIAQTHQVNWEIEKNQRYTDVHDLERARCLSIKMTPMSLVLPDLKGKSHLMNLMDTPGHVNFSDEVSAALRIADGALIVVDVIEGVMVSTENIIKQCIAENVPMTLCINKIDRLILELKLPPQDAYFKIKFAIEEVNNVIRQHVKDMRLSPELGNVVFASTRDGWCFSLASFAQLYAESFPDEDFDVEGFSQRLWGDIYFNEEKRNFRRKPLTASHTKTFVHFILEPLYKIYSTVVGEDPVVIRKELSLLGIHLKASELEMDVKPLLKMVCGLFFGDASALIDIFVQKVQSPVTRAESLVQHVYTGNMTSPAAEAMKVMDPQGPLMIHVVKLFNVNNMDTFSAFGRVMSGTLSKGMTVRVLGESYSPDDEEDMMVQQVKNIHVYAARYQIPVEEAYPGNLVLIEGVDASIVKTATITDMTVTDDEELAVCIFRPLAWTTKAVMKVAVEPVSPSELPKMLEGLRRISKSYLVSHTRVEESGEHVVFGTGELYLDCLLHDLRRLYAEMEVKVSDPVVQFCETVADMSALKCFAETPNKKNKLTLISEPLDKKAAADIESGLVSLSKMSMSQVSAVFTKRYDWDLLSARNIWAFGPTEQGPNVLVNDTLPAETDQKLLFSVRDSIKQGFQWATREGPLADEPVRQVKFRILDSVIANEPIYRGGGQIIPTARRVCYASFLTATPRLMEPVYYAEIQTPADALSVCYDLLARRRGHVTQDIPKPGSPLYTVKAFVPVMDSFGFETDLRTATHGQTFCQLVFDHWQVVPGDPLDKSVVLRPLEPSSASMLAREFMVKTRRRKGLSEDVVVTKFFDDPMLIELAKMDLDVFQ